MTVIALLAIAYLAGAVIAAVQYRRVCGGPIANVITFCVALFWAVALIENIKHRYSH